MKILITGSGGFVGSRIVKYLNKNKQCKLFTPLRKDVNFCDHHICDLYLQTVCPDIIIHLAANSSNKPDVNHPDKIINDNVLATHNLCYYAPQDCRFIFASSISVYGTTPYPVKETYPCNPNTMYGVSKLACEKIVDLYTKHNKIRGINLRFCAIVGKGMTHGMLHDFFEKIKLPTKYFEVFGNEPGTIKPYLYVMDVVNAIKFAIKESHITYPLNIVPNGLMSVKNIAKEVIKKHSELKEIKWLGEKSIWVGDEQVLQASNSRIKELNLFLLAPTSKMAIQQTIFECM